MIYLATPTITGRIIYPDTYSYTTAICNQTNYCKDYIIECDGRELSRLTPTSMAIQQRKDWVDERPKRKLCG